jgi:hypothetical protein
MAKGVRVLVLKYLVRNFTDRYAAIAAPAAPSNAVSIAAAFLDTKSAGSLSAAASFLRKEGGLSGRLKIWQSAL